MHTLLLLKKVWNVPGRRKLKVSDRLWQQQTCFRLLERGVNVGRTICLVTEHVWKGSFRWWLYPLQGDINDERACWRCRGWRPRCALRIITHWATRRRVPRLGKPARSRRSSRDTSDVGLVFVISQAALLLNRYKSAASAIRLTKRTAESQKKENGEVPTLKPKKKKQVLGNCVKCNRLLRVWWPPEWWLLSLLLNV